MTETAEEQHAKARQVHRVLTCDVMRSVFKRALASCNEQLADHYDGPRGLDREVLERQRDEYDRLIRCCSDEINGALMPEEKKPWER